MFFVLFSTDSVPFSESLFNFVLDIKHNFFMAISFALGASSRDGVAQIKVRVQTLNPPLNIKQGTGLYISPTIWKHRHDNRYMKPYLKNEPVMDALNLVEEIRITLEGMFTDGVELNGDVVRDTIYNITNREAIAARRAEEERKRQEEERASRITLGKFMDRYVEEAKAGIRLTVQGKRYADYSITNIQQSINRFHDFENYKGRVYDFEDITLDFYYQFSDYLKQEEYSFNTIGKFINWIKTFMSLAENEGLHNSTAYKDKRFKGARMDVDSIYLTKEDLDKIRNADLSDLHPCYDLARDIFFIGVWTAQRVSDYNNIKPEDIKTEKEERIVQVPVKKGSDKMKSVIVTEENMYISITQKKTGAKVTIPCHPELKRILEKYNYNVPHLYDQKINDYIKVVAEKAGLDELVKVERIKAGKQTVEYVPKHKLVHTHTARRTGATLMYLDGMEVFDIMRITGHSTPLTLKKYIKADELEVAQKINRKYDYFRK